jgi:rod shape-determining protein MreC
VVAVLVLLAITLVTLDARSGGSGFVGDLRSRARDAFAPVQDATHSVLQPIGNFLSGALHYGSLRAENDQLRSQLSALQAKEIQTAYQQQQADQVLAQAHLPFLAGIPTVTGQVIDVGSSNYENSVEINKGTDDGVAVGQPVVTGAGLVGSIGEASAKTSTIVLLTDPTFVVGVALDAAGDVGSAQGYGAGSAMHVNLVSPAVKFTKNQALVTSGLQMEKFPKGIPVGTIAHASTAPGALQQEVTMVPLARLSRLSYVQVLLWSPQ